MDREYGGGLGRVWGQCWVRCLLRWWAPDLLDLFDAGMIGGNFRKLQ